MPAIWVGLFLLLLLPLVVTPSTLFPFVVGKAIYFRGLVEILFALWVLVAVASPRYRLGRSWILSIFAIYVIVNLVAALVGVSFQRSFWGDYRRMGGVFDLVHWFMLLLVLTAMVRNTIHWRWLLNANLGISLILALLGLAQHYDLDVFRSLFWYFEAKDRVDITLGNPTYVGAYMLVNTLVALAFLAQSFVKRPAPTQTHRQRRRHQAAHAEVSYWLLATRSFWVVVILLDLWVLSLAGTRGAFAGLGGALLFAGVVYALWGSRGRLRIVAGAATAALLFLALVFPLLRETPVYAKLSTTNVIFHRLSSANLPISFSTGSFATRLDTAQVGLDAFASAPLLGWGPENFVFAFQKHMRAVDFRRPLLADQAHNRLVSELTTTGVVGFATYIILWGWMGRVWYRKMRSDPEEEILTVALGAALVGYFIQNLLLFDVHTTFLQAALLIGWVASTEVGLQAESPGLRPSPADSGNSIRHRPVPATRDVVDRSGGRGWVSRLSASLSAETARGVAIRWTGASVLGLLLITSLSFMVYRPYRAAQLFPTQSVGWEELWTDARHSFETFPALATLSRQVLFDTLVANWDAINEIGVAEIMDRVQPEEVVALQSDPNNARLYIALGGLYQKAGATDPQ